MHYQNGREAKLGDIAVGPTYNRKGRQIGVIVGITPGTTSCNCRLATHFNAVPVNFDISLLIPKVAQTYSETSGYDYTAVGDLLHIEDYLINSIPNPVVTTEGSSLQTL